MTWVAVAVGGAALVGGAISSDSSRKAAHTQADAAAAANATQGSQYDQTTQRNQPFISGGTTAFNALVGRLGLSHIPTAQDVQNEPGYQFGLDQGQNQLNRQLNAKGMNYSGAQLKAAARYGNDYAGTKYDQAFNRIEGADQQQWNQGLSLAGLGQASANNTAAAGQQFAAQTGNNLMGAANSQAANQLAQGNIANNVLNQGVSAYKNYQAPATTGGYQTAPTQTYTDGGEYYGHADGGPIRGPGGPRDDLIPARLSNGEYVLDADTVNALGGGSNERGQNALNVMRRKLKAK